jgi:hypothetical protein
MRQPNIVTIAIATAVAFAAASADGAERARPKKRAGTAVNVGVLDAGGGFFYGPHYGYPTHPSYWYGPTTGVYKVDPGLCGVQRALPGWFGSWYWTLENIC